MISVFDNGFLMRREWSLNGALVMYCGAAFLDRTDEPLFGTYLVPTYSTYASLS